MIYQKVFIDLDHTLYDTSRLYDHIVEWYIRQGALESEVREAGRKADDRSQGIYDYSPEKHGLMLTQIGRQVSWPSDDSHFFQDYLYDGADLFVRKIREYAKEVILLTAGNRAFQKKKIEGTTLEQLFDAVTIVSGHKENIIEQMNDDHIFFFNDNLNENIKLHAIYPDMDIVCRQRDVYSKAEYDRAALPVAKDFLACLKYMEQGIQ